jgi:hypothetical protein
MKFVVREQPLVNRVGRADDLRERSQSLAFTPEFLIVDAWLQFIQ